MNSFAMGIPNHILEDAIKRYNNKLEGGGRPTGHRPSSGGTASTPPGREVRATPRCTTVQPGNGLKTPSATMLLPRIFPRLRYLRKMRQRRISSTTVHSQGVNSSKDGRFYVFIYGDARVGRKESDAR